MTSSGLSNRGEFNGPFVLIHLRLHPVGPGRRRAFWPDAVNNREVNNYLGMGGHSSAEARQTSGRMAFKNFLRPLGKHDDDEKDDDDPDGHSRSFANGVNTLLVEVVSRARLEPATYGLTQDSSPFVSLLFGIACRGSYLSREARVG
jgi:hypothetical protein